MDEILKNYEIDKENNIIKIKIKTSLYPLEIIYSAAYMFLENFYIIVDGEPEKEIIVQMKSKSEKTDLEKIAGDFNNELINYSVYAIQSARTSAIREAITKRALGTIEEKYDEEEEDIWIKDPEGIAEPWNPEKAEGIEELEEEF